MNAGTLVLVGVGLYLLTQQKAEASTAAPERSSGGSTGSTTNWLDVAKSFLGVVAKGIDAARADAQPQANP